MLDCIPWLLLALLHLPPALPLVRPAMIARLYGAAGDPLTLMLLQHRAALFALMVAICLWAVADPGVRRLASVACAISMLSFLALYALAGAPPALRMIELADLLFLPVLVVAAWRAFSR